MRFNQASSDERKTGSFNRVSWHEDSTCDSSEQPEKDGKMENPMKRSDPFKNRKGMRKKPYRLAVTSRVNSFGTGLHPIIVLSLASLK
jgi:hypothetical protein